MNSDLFQCIFPKFSNESKIEPNVHIITFSEPLNKCLNESFRSIQERGQSHLWQDVDSTHFPLIPYGRL